MLPRPHGAMKRRRPNVDMLQGRVPGIALAAAQGSQAANATATLVRHGGADDPLVRMYGRVWGMGKGGADGEMYRGVVDQGPLQGQMHALKYRNPEDDPSREIQTLKAVCHPNVVELLQVYEPYGERRATVLAFMEADSDLGDVLRRRRGLGPDEQLSDGTRRGIAVQLLAALGHVHHRGMIHRDVKPGNILVRFGEPLETCRDSSGERIPCYLRLQLADFSRARWLPSCSAGRRVCRKTTVDEKRRSVVREEMMSTRVTTALYLAPEVALLSAGEQESETLYGTAIDIWGFGAVLFQVLSGEHLVPEYHGDLTKVIGWIIRRVGPNVTDTAASAMYQSALSLSEQCPATALTKYQGNGWPWVKAALLWKSTERPSAHQLARTPWAEPEAGTAPEPQLGRAPATARGDAATPCASSPLGIFCKAQTPEPLATGATTCACSGHCYQPGHRYRGGCNETLIVSYSAYCLSCKCLVPGCDRPRLRGSRCHKHMAVWEHIPVELRATSAMAAHIIPNVPCDVVDFISHFPQVGGDFLWTMAIALFKEPRATGAMAETGALTRPPTAESLTEAFDAALAAVHEAPHESELRSLNRQGVARFQGVASTLRKWGYLELRDGATGVKRSRAAAQGPGPPQKTYVLGLQGQEYVRSTESVELSVRQLLLARDAVQPEWSQLLLIQDGADALSIARRLRGICCKAAEAAPTILFSDDTGYGVASVVRKVMLALLASGRASVDWGSMSRAELEELCCDQSDFLKAFPEAWSAADVSDFVFGRSDWGIFVSLFACLMKDALKIPNVQPGPVLHCLASPTFGRAADALRAQYGHAVHPALVFKELSRQGHPLSGPKTP